MPLGNSLEKKIKIWQNIKYKCPSGACLPVGRELAYACDLPAGRQAQNLIMYYTYAIKSEIRNYIYVGITNNPNRRINEHCRGYEKTTKPYRPFKTMLIEKYSNRIEARNREKFLKSGFGKEYLKNI